MNWRREREREREKAENRRLDAEKKLQLLPQHYRPGEFEENSEKCILKINNEIIGELYNTARAYCALAKRAASECLKKVFQLKIGWHCRLHYRAIGRRGDGAFALRIKFFLPGSRTHSRLVLHTQAGSFR